ncbi:MAG: serine protease [Desulfurivibrionaceae bacterium]
MHQDIYFQYKGACMMLFHREDDEVNFLGTAFLVNPEGYLLTAAHLLSGKKDYMVVPVEETDAFAPVRTETVAPIDVEVRQVDRKRDLALLRFKEDIDISMPDHILGVPGEAPIGSSVACLGFPFGYYHIYNPLIKQAVISAKILSDKETMIFLFDTLIHDGSRGGPLINVQDGRIIGIVSGRFHPQELLPDNLKHVSETPIRTDVSYAVSIDHAAGLMEKEEITII